MDWDATETLKYFPWEICLFTETEMYGVRVESMYTTVYVPHAMGLGPGQNMLLLISVQNATLHELDMHNAGEMF